MSARSKTTAQVRAIFGEARRRGLDNDTLHELVADVLNSTGSGSRGQTRNSRLGGGDSGSFAANAPAATATAPRAVSIAALTYAQAEKVIERLKGRSFVPRRTLQYRRRKAGIQELVQKSQLQLIAELASQRDWSAPALIDFCKRQCGHYPLRTTKDANSVIEALKSMNKRDSLWAA